MALADSGRVGVVRSIGSDGVASVALGHEDPEKRLQLPDNPQVIQTVSHRQPCASQYYLRK